MPGGVLVCRSVTERVTTLRADGVLLLAIARKVREMQKRPVPDRQVGGSCASSGGAPYCASRR